MRDTRPYLDGVPIAPHRDGIQRRGGRIELDDDGRFLSVSDGHRGRRGVIAKAPNENAVLAGLTARRRQSAPAESDARALHHRVRSVRERDGGPGQQSVLRLDPTPNASNPERFGGLAPVRCRETPSATAIPRLRMSCLFTLLRR